LNTYHHPVPFHTESGATIAHLDIAYTDEGPHDKPVVWVCHALTANADVFDWWAGLFGPDSLFNPQDYRIICANVPGSCYGSTGPLSVNADTGKAYYHDFPLLTIRDMVAALEHLRQHLGIQSIHLLIGGSLGGQQAMEWAFLLGPRLIHLALVATNARHSAWGIAFNEAQRMAIAADASWQECHDRAGDAGMRAARATALLSYRHYGAFAATQTDDEPKIQGFKAQSYQQYQGEKLSRRFNAFSYFRLSQAMDSHHMGRGRASVEYALVQITAKTLVIGIDTDMLFPLAEQRYLAQFIPRARFTAMHSDFGHDGFLIETGQLTRLLQPFTK
jgi:homoserine O-acetyltransferase